MCVFNHYKETAKSLMMPRDFLSFLWLRGRDLNPRSLGYEPSELTTSPPRNIKGSFWIDTAQVNIERK